MQASAGISDLFAKVDGKPRQAPINICDRVTGLYLTISLSALSITGRLPARDRRSRCPCWKRWRSSFWATTWPAAPLCRRWATSAICGLLSRHRGPYPTKDGHICIVVYTDKHWRAFTELVGDPTLIDRDPEFADQTVRTKNAELCGAYLAKHMTSRTTGEWLEFCRTIDIPAAQRHDA